MSHQLVAFRSYLTDYAVGLAIGLVYALLIWGAFSLVGFPGYWAHHETEALIWTGLVYGLGYGSARSARR